jgi:hypothetical protein
MDYSPYEDGETETLMLGFKDIEVPIGGAD